MEDHVQISRLTALTKGRITQICTLTLLAPEIQETILDPNSRLPPTRVFRRIVRDALWGKQNDTWCHLCTRHTAT